MAKTCQKFYIQSASYRNIFAHFTKRYNSEDISIQEQELNTQTSCDRVGSGTELYIAHGGWGKFYRVSEYTFYFKQFRHVCLFQVACSKREVPWKDKLAFCKGWQLAFSLFCLLSIKGFVLYCKVQISIGFANKVAKIWPKSNSLVTYKFWAKIQGCTFATTKVKSICKHICA